MSKPTIVHVYNPKNQTHEQLIDGFVVRQATFQKLFRAIRDTRMEHPEQHFLITGKRGMGKTTLLLRMAYEVEKDPDLNQWLVPIAFNEEEYGIRKLYRFWERIIELLIEREPDFEGLNHQISLLSERFTNDNDYEKRLFDSLEEKLQEKGKKMILFIDNFGEMFRKFSAQEAHRLRKILQTSAELRIFAASSVVLEAFYDYSHPFYEFFQVERLEGLSTEDTQRLLLKLADLYDQQKVADIVENQWGRVESLRRLSGGVIRTIILLFEIFIDEQGGDALRDLEGVLDRVTPFYKHRMDELSPQQQEIVEIIALNWDAIGVREIATHTRLESKVISAQLHQLIKYDLVHKIATGTKNHLYQISERFFNIWFLMRHGRRNDKRRVLWLIRFLEEWCTADELLERADKHIHHLRQGDFQTQAAYLVSEALAHTRQLSKEKQHELLSATRAFLEQKESDFRVRLSRSDIDLAQQADEAFLQEEFEAALALYLRMNRQDHLRIGRCYSALKNMKKAEDHLLKAIEQGEVEAFTWLGILHQEQYSYELARAYYEKAIEQGDQNALLALGNLYFLQRDYQKAEKLFIKAKKAGKEEAYFALGRVYRLQRRYKLAEKYLKLAIEQGNSEALSWLGWLYRSQGNAHLAEKYLKKAIENGNLHALYHLGKLYKSQGQYDEAERFLQRAVDQGHRKAVFQLGVVFQVQGKLPQAETCFLKAVEYGNPEAQLYLGNVYKDRGQYELAEQCFLKASQRGQVEALNDLANLYRTQGRSDLAEKYFLQAIEKGNINAINKLGYLYLSQGKYEEAEEYFLRAVQSGDLKAISNLGYLYHELGDYARAETYYLKCVEQGDPIAMNNLAYLYYESRQKKAEALDLAAKAFLVKDEPATRLTYAKVLAWDDQFEESFRFAGEIIYDEQFVTRYLSYFQDYLLLLIAKKQFDFLEQYFHSDQAKTLQLKERLKPLYYALMHITKDRHPQEHLRMGEELQETVKEILGRLERMEKELD